tara:strand:- start:82 stop:1311 length:1230 start_codon:yes stop_codon:yes gene_type:complete
MSLYGNQDKKTLTGTVTTSGSDATVTGSGTAFTTEVEVGDIFLASTDTDANRILSIASDTSLELTANYNGDDPGSGKTAYIRQTPRYLSPTESNAIFGVSVSEVTGGQDNVVSITPSNQGSGYVNAGDAALTIPAPTVRTIATSNVSTSDNTITITGHNILTGTKFTYQDGSGTALAGLTDNTAYYAIKVDNDTIKLATSLNNANAGTAINLTGTGNNAQTLEGDTATATPVVTAGKLASITVTAGGSDYQTAPTITVAAATNATFNANAASTADDTITLSSAEVAALAVGDAVTYTNGGGSQDIGLTTATVYYIHSKPTSTTVKLKASADASDAIDLTAGSSEADHGLRGESATATATLGSGNKTGQPGWVKRTVGTGGRAGRINYEVLVASSSITTDAGDDIEFPDE